MKEKIKETSVLTLERRDALKAFIAATAGVTGASAYTDRVSAEASGNGTTYYLDCSSPAGGDGTVERPFNDISAINAVELDPGDAVRFKRGCTFEGTFAPQGAGTEDTPIQIGAYGEGSKPVIDGNGAQDAVLLKNLEYIEVRDLEIINAANPGTRRNGVRLLLENFGTGHHYHLENLDIHNVRGGDVKGLFGSAGILVTVLGREKPSSYNGLQIVNNHIYDVDREGIYFKSRWSDRPLVGNQQGDDYLSPWTPSTDVRIAHNLLEDLAGDGIKIDTTTGAVVEHNRIDGFRLRSNACNAGLWTFNTDDTIVQFNEVSGGRGGCDGMAFDADGGSNHTVFQYNYSHNNGGGFLLLCSYAGSKVVDPVARYNISYNDADHTIFTCPGIIQDAQIYNNTFYTDETVPEHVLYEGGSPQEITLRNNIFANHGEEHPRFRITAPGGLRIDHNAFYRIGNIPTNPDGSVNPGGMDAAPRLVNPEQEPDGISDLGGFRLHKLSPALDAGKVIPNNGGRDFFGRPVSNHKTPNIGAYDGPGVPATQDPAMLTLHTPEAGLVPGETTPVTSTLHWWSRRPGHNVQIRLEAPEGWNVEIVDSTVPDPLHNGDEATVSWRVTPAVDAEPDEYRLVAVATYGAGNSGGKIETSTAVKVTQLFPSLKAAFTNNGITSDANSGTGELGGTGGSFSFQALTEEGIVPGGTFSYDGVTFTWPDVPPAAPDNVRADGQTIGISQSGEQLGFVTTGTYALGGISGTGSVHYADDTSQTFTLPTGDWYYNTAPSRADILVTTPYRNKPSGQDERPVSLYVSTISIDPDKTVEYVTLPDIDDTGGKGITAMHIFAMAIE